MSYVHRNFYFFTLKFSTQIIFFAVYVQMKVCRAREGSRTQEAARALVPINRQEPDPPRVTAFIWRCRYEPQGRAPSVCRAASPTGTLNPPPKKYTLLYSSKALKHLHLTDPFIPPSSSEE